MKFKLKNDPACRNALSMSNMAIEAQEKCKALFHKQFKRQFFSRVLNNHCQVCGFFPPEWYDEFLEVREERKTHSNMREQRDKLNPKYSKENYFSRKGYSTCPSCQRGIIIVYLQEHEKSLKKVPDDWRTALHRSPDILIKLPDPILPRDCFNSEAWKKHLKEAQSWGKIPKKKNKDSKSKEPKRKDPIDILANAKVIKRKLKL